MFPQISLGEKIKYYRKRAKMRQLELELALDIAPGHISRIENNQINPSKETLTKIAKVLKLKDTEVLHLFDFLNIENEQDQEIFIKLYDASCNIKYGEEFPTESINKLTIQANHDGVDKYYYFNHNSSSRFKRISGFIDKDSKYRAINKFETWNGSIGKGAFSNLNRITLQIKKINKYEQLTLIYAMLIDANFVEIVKDKIPTSHFYFFRMICHTLETDLNYHIPNGEISTIVNLVFCVEYKNENIIEQSIDYKEGKFKLPENYGEATVKIDDKYTTVNWRSQNPVPAGTLYKLYWYTKPK